MEVYQTEEEQIDAIKKWWRQNGASAVTGIVVGLAALVGWQQWTTYVSAQQESASMEYEMLLTELEVADYTGVQNRGSRIQSEYADTVYASLTSLALAKVKVEEEDLVGARMHLQSVMESAEPEPLRRVARLRIARLLLAEGAAAQALSMLNGVEFSGFESALAELKGDIHLAMENPTMARSAYQSALDTLQPGGDRSVLEIKLDELGGAEGNG